MNENSRIPFEKKKTVQRNERYFPIQNAKDHVEPFHIPKMRHKFMRQNLQLTFTQVEICVQIT